MKTQEKTIKYGDTLLTLAHYKEPLRAVKKGYGYEGCLLSTVDGTKVQCHICGNLFSELGAHVRQSHEMTIRDYKEKFQLAYGTSLISEQIRNVRKERTLEWIKGMKNRYGENWRERFIKQGRDGQKKRGRFQPTLTLESKNKRGVCPDQLLHKLKEVTEVIGHVPSKKEFITATGTQRYVHLIYKTFGSYSVALKKVGLIQKKNNTSNNTSNSRNRYDDEELLEYLRIFYETNKKIPTETDCGRGFIPPSTTYRSHFGSLPKARELAGIFDTPTRWTTLKRTVANIK